MNNWPSNFLIASSAARALRVFDERKAAGAAGFAVERADDLRRLTDLREVRTQIVFGCLIGQIAHEQSDWWHGCDSNGWRLKQ